MSPNISPELVSLLPAKSAAFIPYAGQLQEALRGTNPAWKSFKMERIITDYVRGNPDIDVWILQELMGMVMGSVDAARSYIYAWIFDGVLRRTGDGLSGIGTVSCTDGIVLHRVNVETTQGNHHAS